MVQNRDQLHGVLIKAQKQAEQAGTHTHTVTISNTGSNYPHNNLQPYISVYCWRRTA
ncbi:phage baseplate protein [Phascolarctobacterium faecium]|uniref:phage baseplate protein n=1 Tax=Phascolarctobacterium faecium TaxID=33025 RepID=UPI003C6E6487